MSNNIFIYHITTFLGIIGAISEIIWMASVVEAWIIDNDKTRAFYNKHKVIRNIQFGFCVFGCLYFLCMLFTGNINV